MLLSRLVLKMGSRVMKINFSPYESKELLKTFQNPYRSLKSASNSIFYSRLKFGRILLVFRPIPQKNAMLARSTCRTRDLGLI